MATRDDDPLAGLPENWRHSGQPIIIYQAPPPRDFDSATSSSLGVLFWLALITVCLTVAGVSVWTMWNPNHAGMTDNKRWFSPIYAEGRPLGLNKLIEEREQISAAAAGLLQYRELARAGREASQPHPLITGPSDSIDALRAQWDAGCRSMRRQIYQARINRIEADLLRVRRRLTIVANPADRAALAGEAQRIQETQRQNIRLRDADGDPSLSCTRAAQADVCSQNDHEAWCDGGDDVFNRRRR
jgi:hypothetical protein